MISASKAAKLTGSASRAGIVSLLCACLLVCGSLSAAAQYKGSASSTSQDTTATGAPTSTYNLSTQSPYAGSVPEGEATSAVLPLSFKEAIDRALRNNLGLLIGSDNLLTARGQRWQELSHLLPNVSASAIKAAQQIDLAALGFRFKFPGVPPVVGPLGTFDARVYVTAPFFDWHAIQRERGARASEMAAQYDYRNARELVVLATGNVYLLAISAAARVDAAQAQLETAQALFSRAHDQ